MDLYPIGTVSAGSNQGTIDGISYSMFEPNAGCKSKVVFYNLTTQYENITIDTREKAPQTINLSFNYEGIFTREYRQLDHFIYFVKDGLNSFHVVDFSKGMSPSSVDTTSNWVAYIDDTRLFSTISNQKANWVFFWNTSSWKLGQVTTVSTNTYISCDISDNYGAMTTAQAETVTGSIKTLVYPVYEVFLVGGVDSFKEQDYVDKQINLTSDGGTTYSGNLVFNSRYKV